MKVVGVISIFVFASFIGFTLLKSESYYLSIDSRQQGDELAVFGETNLPNNSVLEISVAHLDVSGSVTVENGNYGWKVQCPINVPSGNIQIIISCSSKDFENSTIAFWARVNTPLTPEFTCTREAYTVEFVDNSSDNDGTIVSWKWEFGTGEISNDQNPTLLRSEILK